MRKRLLPFVLVAFASVLLVLMSRQSAEAQTDYRIGPQDVLSIQVLGEPELTNKFTVEQDGTFTFPYIGRVKAAGLTLREFEQALIKALSPEYLKNPQVTVSFETYRSQKILVMGEVHTPGEYLLNGDTTLLAALARAGSTTLTAGHEALIIRPRRRADGSADAGGGVDVPTNDDSGTNTELDPSGSEIIRVDLSELSAGNLSRNITLMDGDTVNIPKAQLVFVSGFVKAPGGYPVERNDTTVLQMLTLAGGLTDRGRSSGIQIQRTVKGKKVDINVKPTDIVQPGDLIIVKAKFF